MMCYKYILYLCTINKHQTNMKKKFISYRRVSTRKQGASGLGLEAQADIIRYFVEREQGEIIEDYQEVHSGKDLNECAILRQAITATKKTGAILIIAKSDRFRNVSQALQVLDEVGEGSIMFCDLPHTDRFTLTLFFALAERERLITSIRTKQALQAKKERGERLGSPLFVGVDGESRQEQEDRKQRASEVRERAIREAAKSRKATADGDTNNRKAWAAIKPIYQDKNKKMTLRKLADYLNNNTFTTSTGGQFSPVAVQRLIKRYGEL